MGMVALALLPLAAGLVAPDNSMAVLPTAASRDSASLCSSSPQLRPTSEVREPRDVGANSEAYQTHQKEGPLKIQQQGADSDLRILVRLASPNLDPGSSPIRPTTFPMYFCLNAPNVSEVTVVGSWSHWSIHFKLIKNDSIFAGWIEVPEGKHHFKFISDGT